jgi:integrase
MLIKRGRYYHYQCKIHGKPWHRSTGETDKKAAMRHVTRLERIAEMLRGSRGSLPTLDQAAVAEYARIKADVSDGQATRFEYAVKQFKQFVGNPTLDRISPELVEAYQRKRLQEAARATVDKELCLILRMLRNQGFEVRRPSAKRGKVTKLRPFTRDELDRFFRHCPGHLKCLYATMYCTDARLTELMPSSRTDRKGLLKSEVDLGQRLIVIRTAKGRSGEAERERVLPIPVWLVPRLEAQMGTSEGAFVFPYQWNLRRTFEHILKAAGIPKADELGRVVTMHSFRHTFSTYLKGRTDPFTHQAAMGHRKLETTAIYTHVSLPEIPLPHEPRILTIPA